MTTLAPSRAAVFAMQKPMPREPPAMKTVLPFSEPPPPSSLASSFHCAATAAVSFCQKNGERAPAAEATVGAAPRATVLTTVPVAGGSSDGFCLVVFPRFRAIPLWLILRNRRGLELRGLWLAEERRRRRRVGAAEPHRAGRRRTET